MTVKCCCGLLSIKTGAWIVAGLDLLLSACILPTFTINLALLAFAPEAIVNKDHPNKQYMETMSGIPLIITIISMILITLIKIIVVLILAQGIKQENEKLCKPWFWLNLILLWMFIVSGVASAVVAGFYNKWFTFPIMLFILSFPVALGVYLLYVIYTFSKEIR